MVPSGINDDGLRFPGKSNPLQTPFLYILIALTEIQTTQIVSLKPFASWYFCIHAGCRSLKSERLEHCIQ